MSVIAFLNYEESALLIYQKTSTVSIISEQPSYKVEILLKLRIFLPGVRGLLLLDTNCH